MLLLLLEKQGLLYGYLILFTEVGKETPLEGANEATIAMTNLKVRYALFRLCNFNVEIGLVVSGIAARHQDSRFGHRRSNFSLQLREQFNLLQQLVDKLNGGRRERLVQNL